MPGHEQLAAATNISVIEGDITQPRLGISDAAFEELCSEVDVIHHIAARVNHIRPYEVLKAPNVDSVADIISIAQKGRDKIVNFVSTLGSAAKKDKDGRYVEAFPGNAVLNSDMGYLLSKWESERLLEKFQDQGEKLIFSGSVIFQVTAIQVLRFLPITSLCCLSKAAFNWVTPRFSPE